MAFNFLKKLFKTERREFIDETSHFLKIYYFYEIKEYVYEASKNESIRVYVDKIKDQYVIEYFIKHKSVFVSKKIINEVFDMIPDKRLLKPNVWKKIMENFLDVKIKQIFIYG